jgi:hypothetical protein
MNPIFRIAILTFSFVTPAESRSREKLDASEWKIVKRMRQGRHAGSLLEAPH